MGRPAKEFSLADLKRRVQFDLGQAKSINDKNKLYKTYQDILKQEEALAEDVKEQILVEEIEIGDAIVDFVQGKTKKLNEVFEISKGPGTLVRFTPKKKLDTDTLTEAVCCLVAELNRQNSFEGLF